MLSGGGSGIVGYRKVRAASRLVLGLGALAGAASLGGAAWADDAGANDMGADADAASTVAQVEVTGQRRPLDRDTSLSVMATTVQDTPQAISVIDAAQLKAQGINSLEGALRNVPGITIAIGEGGTLNGDQFKIRGFDSKDDVYVDGLRDFGAYSRDSFNYEEVQVLKGPSGAMFGRGATGGAINTISKRPKLDDFVVLDGYVGNGDYRRALADINHRFGETTAARLNLMATTTGVVDRDHIDNRRWGAAVTLATGIGTATTASLSYLYQHSKGRPDYGITIVQRPGDIVALPASEYDVGVERSSFLGFLNDTDRNDADIMTVRLSHQPNDKLIFNSDFRYGAYSRYFQYSTLDQCASLCTTQLFDGNPATEPPGGIGGSSPYDASSWGLQNITTARIDYDLGALRNQLILGLDLSRQASDRTYLAYTLPPGFATRPAMPHFLVNPNPVFPAGYTLFTPAPGTNLPCPATGACTTTLNGATVTTNVAATGTFKSRGESTDGGVFITDRIWLMDNLSVIGSLRLDSYKAELSTLQYNGVPAQVGGLTVKSRLLSPRVSVVFEPADDQTYYASWGRSQTPQGTSVVGAGGAALTITAKDLEPEDSEIWEAGAKARIPGTSLSATASIFDIKKDNALQADPATGFLLVQSGEKQEVKGIELGLTGKLTDRWTLSLGYTYLDAKIKESFTNCTVAAANATGAPTAITCAVGATVATPTLNKVAVGEQVTFVPKNSASVFTSYDLSDWIPGLTVGGDATYQSRLSVGYTARSVSFADRASQTPVRLAEVPESISLNAFASYETGRYRFAINAYNLTDRLNYAQVFSNRATPAAGRTIILSVGARF